MTEPAKKNFKVYQGSTFREVLRWETSTKVYKPITAITQAAPVVVTAVGHGAPIGWRAKISNVVGMKEINTDNYLTITDKTTDTVTFNELNTVGYSAYTSGGILSYNQPRSLSGVTGRMQIRSKIDSTDVLDELTTANGGILIDDSLKTITIYISATDTAAYTFTTPVYSLELVEGSDVIPFLTGTLTLVKEVTR